MAENKENNKLKGHVKMFRSFIDWEWFDTSNMVIIFIYCLLKANWKDKKWRGIDVKRGSFITSYNTISKDTGITVQSVRTCLKKLKNTKEISQKSTNKYTMLTICNYDSYQSKENTTNKQLTINQHTTNKQLTTTKKEKKEKNINIPTQKEFKAYALDNGKEVDIYKLGLKYKSWVANNWKDGNNKPIKNWKTKLLNTLPFLEKQKQSRL